MLRTIAGYILGATAVLACPCHLALTLPLLLVVLGGPSLGLFLTENLVLVSLAAGAYFLVGLAGAIWLLGRREAGSQKSAGLGAGTSDACCTPIPRELMARTRKQLKEVHHG